MNITGFVEYVLSFYASGQIYDIGATPKEVILATARRLDERPDVPFDGDSFDRELVRYYLLVGRE